MNNKFTKKKGVVRQISGVIGHRLKGESIILRLLILFFPFHF